MANEFYKPGVQRASRVNELFARIAHRYDLINDLQSFGLHRYWKRRVIQLARITPGSPALDVCCGTGDITCGLARAGAKATGLDFSPEMLQVARQRGMAGTTFLQGDAQQLPFPDATFEAVTVGYGLRNLTDWRTGLREMARVARPGGRILVLEFGKPENPIWRGLYFSYLRLIVPLLGLVFCGQSSAYAYILESLKHYPAQRGVEEEMRRIGLDRIGIVSFMGGVMTINHGVRPQT
jgi:demethylmenaquinone methyltransferase/2-methoxy-6-polyprenyl-1,4-benzoquinol methylase